MEPWCDQHKITMQTEYSISQDCAFIAEYVKQLKKSELIIYLLRCYVMLCFEK